MAGFRRRLCGAPHRGHCCGRRPLPRGCSRAWRRGGLLERPRDLRREHGRNGAEAARAITQGVGREPGVVAGRQADRVRAERPEGVGRDGHERERQRPAPRRLRARSGLVTGREADRLSGHGLQGASRDTGRPRARLERPERLRELRLVARQHQPRVRHSHTAGRPRHRHGCDRCDAEAAVSPGRQQRPCVVTRRNRDRIPRRRRARARRPGERDGPGAAPLRLGARVVAGQLRARLHHVLQPDRRSLHDRPRRRRLPASRVAWT